MVVYEGNEEEEYAVSKLHVNELGSEEEDYFYHISIKSSLLSMGDCFQDLLQIPKSRML